MNTSITPIPVQPAPLLRGLGYGIALLLSLLMAWPTWAAAPFTVNANGTVTDSSTKLVWDRCTYGLIGSDCSAGTAFLGDWYQALAAAAEANTTHYKGFTDWRVPNNYELGSLTIGHKSSTHAIDTTAFPNTPLTGDRWNWGAAWTSTTYAYDPNRAAFVSFGYYGYSDYYWKTELNYVRLVRDAFGPFMEQTPPDRVDLPVDSTAAPAVGHKAVVMTHGHQSNVSAWALEMANDLCLNNKIGVLVSVKSPPSVDNNLYKICQVRAAGNVLWDVWVLDWRKRAANTSPYISYGAAKGVAEYLAKQLEGNHYGHIHLIAHSAGSNVIHAATPRLKASGAKIHATFLDAYDPWAMPYRDSTGNARHLSSYGSSADYVDNYVDTRALANLNWLPGGLTDFEQTDLHLVNGYNIDVSPQGTGCSSTGAQCRHSRPYRFYGKSVDNSFTDLNDEDPVGNPGTMMGFARSLEGGGTVALLATIKNQECRMQVSNGSCVGVPNPTAGLLWYLPTAFGETLVDTTVGTINYVAGVGTTLFNVIRFGAGLLSGSSAASMTTAASAVPTESPSSIVVLATTTQPVNTMRFNWRFATAGEGYLRVFVDGNLVRELDQRYVPLASTAAEEVYIGGANGMLPAGTHRIAFRLDGFGSSASAIELTNVELGLSVGDDFPDGGIMPTGWMQPVDSVAPWAVASDAAYSGTFSLKSGVITHSQRSALSYTANFAPGNVSFARKVSSESNFDFLQFYIDGVLQNSWSGELDWAVVTFPISAGTHTLLWRYMKDGSVSSGSDAAWIDSVTLPGVLTVPGAPTILLITPGPAHVTLVLQPPGNTGGGAIVSYSATCSASGYPNVTATSTTTTVVVPGLVPGVSYACTATASNGGYASAATPAASAIPKPRVDLTPILMLLLD